ncbi:MAG: cytochrome c3 family protein [Deferribacteraceae bacterium]|jgi:fumarate reductase flavoprotein subunit|nr:cytochrome c3 family protein [Deferribacteraceae bacterium]
MEKIYLTAATLTVLTVFIAFAAFSADTGKEIRGAHLENGLECADCHETAAPVKRAGQNSCIGCHGDKTDDIVIKVIEDAKGNEYKSAIHTSHAGTMRCTLCHASHQPSKLYCNEGCHHTWQMEVP